MFATYNVKADRLTVLKTSFPEELELTGRSPATAPKVISMVAFRCAAGSCRIPYECTCSTLFCVGMVCAVAACGLRLEATVAASLTAAELCAS
jgi:hypothetical protein